MKINFKPEVVFTNIANPVMVSVDSSKKAQLRRVLKGAVPCLDIRWFVRWTGQDAFQMSAKGFFVEEEPFLRDILPEICKMYGYALVKQEEYARLTASQNGEKA